MTRLLPPLVLFACQPLGDDLQPKPDDLSPAWRIDKVRVLGIRAEPPEVRLGETSAIEALLIDPEGEVGVVVWNACPPEDADGVGLGCLGALGEGLADLDPSSLDPDALAEAGFIGVDPFFPPTYTPTCEDVRWPDACAVTGTTCGAGVDAATCCDTRGLGACPQVDQLYALVQLAALPTSVLDGLQDGELQGGDADVDVDGDGRPRGIDVDQVEIAYKRVVVSAAQAPNANPVLEGWTVDGLAIGPGAVVEVEPGQEYELAVVLPDATIERYTYIPSDCREGGAARDPVDACADGFTADTSDPCAPTCRTEEPYVTWYADGGSVREGVTLYPFVASTWRAPSPDADVQQGTWWAVVRDRRGGMSWASQRWRVRGRGEADPAAP